MSNVSFMLGTLTNNAGKSAVDGAIYVSRTKKCIGLGTRYDTSHGTTARITTLVGPPAKTLFVPSTENLVYDINQAVRSMGAGTFELVLLWKLASSNSGNYKYDAQRLYFNVASTISSTDASYFSYYGGDATIPAQTLYYYNGALATTESKAIETSVKYENQTIQVHTSIAINYSGKYANITCCPRMILNKLATNDYDKDVDDAGLNPWGT